MSRSALEGGAVFEGEGQSAIRVGRGIFQQAAPELFAEGGDLAVLLFQNPNKPSIVPRRSRMSLICCVIASGRPLSRSTPTRWRHNLLDKSIY